MSEGGLHPLRLEGQEKLRRAFDLHMGARLIKRGADAFSVEVLGDDGTSIQEACVRNKKSIAVQINRDPNERVGIPAHSTWTLTFQDTMRPPRELERRSTFPCRPRALTWRPGLPQKRLSQLPASHRLRLPPQQLDPQLRPS